MAAAAGTATTYDAHYLAFAERLNAELRTADARLIRQAGPSGPIVRLVPESSAPGPASPRPAPEPIAPIRPA